MGELGIYRSIKKGNLSIFKVLAHNSWASEKTVANLQSLPKDRWASNKLLTGNSKAFVKFKHLTVRNPQKLYQFGINQNYEALVPT